MTSPSSTPKPGAVGGGGQDLTPASAPRTALPTPAGVICRLPYADISEATGAFLSYPGGEQSPDPAATVALPGGVPGRIGQNPGLTYVGSGVWAPVPATWVGPQGKWYVYEVFQGFQIREVNLTDGSSRDVTSDGGWNIVGTAESGVYLGKNGSPGVWFVQFGRTPTQVVDHGSNWQAFHGGAVWGVDSSGNLVRRDTTTGAETIWGRGFIPQFEIWAFDAVGEPIVGEDGPLAIYHADGSRTEIWSGANQLYQGGRVVVDAHGIWFSVGGGLVGAPGHGIYLWTPSCGAKLALATEVYPAGSCLP